MIGAALLALAVLLAAAAAAVGVIDTAPVWLASILAALAAAGSLLFPEIRDRVRKRQVAADDAARKRQAAADRERQAAARLGAQLDDVQRRFRMHLASSTPFAEPDDATALLQRLVRRRGTAKGSGEVTSLAELVQSLGHPSSGATNRLLLLGEGGVGKTTSLLQLASDAAARARSDPLAPIPVYVQLSTFEVSERGFDRLQEMAANAMLGVDEAGFDRCWREGTRPLLLLLDGLNEQHGAAAACVAGVRELAERRPHLCVVTSRSTVEADALGAPDVGFCTAELLRLDPPQVERFLVDHGLGRLHEEMGDALKGLTRNPFMLMALVRSTAGRGDAELPRNVGELYRSFVDDYIYALREPVRGHVRYAYEEVKKPLLAALAARMTAEGRTVEPGGLAADAFVKDRLTAALADGAGPESMPDPWGPKGFRAEVVANGILRPVDGGVEFLHQSVQEYFTAVALKNEPVVAVVGRTRPLVWRHLDLERQEDTGAEDPYRVPVTMLSGLRPSSDDLVTTLAPRHPVLAAECVGAATGLAPGLVARLRGEWLALLGRAHERYRAVGAQCLGTARMSGDEVIAQLIDVAVDDPDYAVRRSATAALDQLGTAGAEDHLAAKVQRPGPYDTATQLLIARAPRRAVRVLVERWARSSPGRRAEVEGALRRVDRGTAADELAAVAAPGGGPIGEAAWTLLDRLDSASDEPGIPFAEELRRRMRDWQERAEAQVAGKSPDELIELLSGPNAYTRSAAATALGATGRTDSVPTLIEALSKQPSGSLTVDNMARAARQLDGERATTSLLGRVDGPDTVALVSLPGPWPPDLAPGAVPEAVGDALEKAGVGRPEEAVGGPGRWELKKSGSSDLLVEDRDGRLTVFRTGVRARVLGAAALITPNDRLVPALLARLDHADAGVRATALDLLSERPDVDITGPVAALLERETAEPVVAAAAAALARAGTADAHDLLVDLVARDVPAVDWIGMAFARLEQPEKLDELLCARAERERGDARAALLHALSVVRRRQVTLASGDPATHDRSRAMLVAAALADTDDDARLAAATALRWSAGDPGTAALVKGLEAAEPMRRARAARALGMVQDDRAASALAEALEREEDLPTRVSIAASLVELRADESLPAATRVLVDLILSEEDVALRRCARTALDRARGVAGIRGPIVDRLVELADSERDDDVERAVGSYLEGLDGVDETGALFLWIRGISRARRGRYEDALSDYDTAFRHNHIPAVHRDRAVALAALGRHAEALTAQRLADDDPEDAVLSAGEGPGEP